MSRSAGLRAAFINLRGVKAAIWPPVLAGACLLAAWWITAAIIARPYVLPAPHAVAGSLIAHHRRIAWHAGATLAEIGVGLAIGLSLGFTLGYVVSRRTSLERLFMPVAVASQAVPIVAVAPLLVYWFGPGFWVKAGTAAVIVFFPLLVTTVAAFRGVSRAHRDLFRTLSATPLQTLVHLEIPAALPVLLAGVRVSVTLSVIGAVVGEFLGSSRGLGALVQVAGGQFNDELLFAALLTLIGLALSLYAVAAGLERVLLKGRQAPIHSLHH